MTKTWHTEQVHRVVDVSLLATGSHGRRGGRCVQTAHSIRGAEKRRAHVRVAQLLLLLRTIHKAQTGNSRTPTKRAFASRDKRTRTWITSHAFVLGLVGVSKLLFIVIVLAIVHITSGSVAFINFFHVTAFCFVLFIL